MEDHLSTTQVGWLLGRSANAVRQMIREGEIEASRIPAGFRIPREEVLRVSREKIEEEAGRKVSEAELQRLIEEVLATNDERVHQPVRLVRRRRKG